MTTRPPGARHCGNDRSSASSAENSSFTAMRSAWKRAADRHLHVGLRQIRQRRGEPGAHQAFDGVGRLDRLLLQQTGDEMRRAVHRRSPVSRRRELLFAQAREQLRRGFTTRWIHPHVERTGLLVAEAAIGIVDLHRGHAKVRKDQVRGRESLGGEHLRQAREVPVACDERLGAEAGGAQTRFRARQLERIDVESDQASAGLHAFQDRPRMPTAAERAVDRDVAGPGSKAAEDFLHHDRSMRARRRLAGREDLLHVRGVALGVQFLVLVVERRGFLPGYRGRRVCTGGASGGLFSTREHLRNSLLMDSLSSTGRKELLPARSRRQPTGPSSVPGFSGIERLVLQLSRSESIRGFLS